MPKTDNLIQLAVIGAAHGIKGEVRVKTFTADPMALGDYGALLTKDGRLLEVVNIRPQSTVVVARFKGVNDRNAAEGLNGTGLFVDRSALPAGLDDEEFYHADLVGMDVRDNTGAIIGKVTSVQNFGGGDILELALSGHGEVLVPFTKAAVPEVSVSGRSITIDPVAAGLIDEEDDHDASHPELSPEKGTFDPKRRPRGPGTAGGNR